MVSALISRVITLLFGTLYPAYRSYKAIKNKDVREYVKWMMYWIVFALFTTGESFADFFLSWLPLYYEIKIVFIIWLLSPATKGSSIIYRKFVHPRLVKHEKSIDRYISKAQTNSYATLMDVGRKGLNVATDTLVKTAVTGQYQLVQTLKKYNSMQELNRVGDTTDAGRQQRQSQRNTWYEGMSENNFNPDEDVDVLQQQYRPRTVSPPIMEDPSERGDMKRAMSEDNLRTVDTYTSAEDALQQEMGLTAEEVISSREPSETNYAYSSSTLPRARKQRKPLYEDYALHYSPSKQDHGLEDDADESFETMQRKGPYNLRYPASKKSH